MSGVFKLMAILVAVQLSCSLEALNVDELVIVIINQQDRHHAKIAEQLRQNIFDQANANYGKNLNVVMSKELVTTGDWTFSTLVSPLLTKYPFGRWFIACNEFTFIGLIALINFLGQFEDNQAMYIGHPVQDVEPTIIHHFSPKQRTFPNIGSGVAFTKLLLEKLQIKLLTGLSPPGDFAIDSSYELAMMLESLEPAVYLTPAPDTFCIIPKPQCATHSSTLHTCGDPVEEYSVLFAVKTCKLYHESRAEIVLKTWGKYLSNIIFFTDDIDESFPAPMEVLDGVKPVESGHCDKLRGILFRAHEIMKQNSSIQWLVVADDDTILGISRLCEVLSCLGDGSREHIALGEKYGYGHHKRKGEEGFDYITGGGGIVLSVATINKILEKGQCPSCSFPRAPDDMWLGNCLRAANIPITHSALFHQARPADYPVQYLIPHKPVSFHKHWLIDPIAVYKDWFEQDDINYFGLYEHDEL